MTTLLRNDGSLDVERINRLPYDEFKNIIAKLTEEQLEYYYSHLPTCVSKPNIIPTKVNYRLEDVLANGTLVDAEKFLNDMMEQYG